MSIRTHRVTRPRMKIRDVYTKLPVRRTTRPCSSILQLRGKNKLSLIHDLISSRPCAQLERASGTRRSRRPPPSAARKRRHKSPETKLAAGQAKFGQQSLRKNRRGSIRQPGRKCCNGARLGGRMVQAESRNLSRFLRSGFQDAEGRSALAKEAVRRGGAARFPTTKRSSGR